MNGSLQSMWSFRGCAAEPGTSLRWSEIPGSSCLLGPGMTKEYWEAANAER